jgi:hypothetical protein
LVTVVSFNPLQGCFCRSMSHQVDCLPEQPGVLYVNLSVILPGLQVGHQTFNHIFGVHVYFDWLVRRYDFDCCDDCSDFAYLVGLRLSGDS